jgi:hypothetical protein
MAGHATANCFLEGAKMGKGMAGKGIFSGCVREMPKHYA